MIAVLLVPVTDKIKQEKITVKTTTDLLLLLV